MISAAKRSEYLRILFYDVWYLGLVATHEAVSFYSNAENLACQERQRLVQFLMALRDDFERLRGTILHHHPYPSVDIVVSKLLVEKDMY